MPLRCYGTSEKKSANKLSKIQTQTHSRKVCVARSIETDFTNDVAGRVTAKTFPAASAENVAFTYNSTASGNKGVGRLTSLTDQSGSTAFVYDALGHVSSDTRVIASHSYGTAYTYDAAGNILTETYPSGRIVTYTRDALGQISGITTKQNSGRVRRHRRLQRELTSRSARCPASPSATAWRRRSPTIRIISSRGSPPPWAPTMSRT